MPRQHKPLRRGYGRRVERQRFLIYCEGELTEITYFKGVRRELRASTVRLEIVAGRGEPHGLVEKAVDHQRRAPRSEADGFEPYDQVWCVFDVEAPRPHARLAAALALARRNRVHCAISNPCFELWLLLHFQDQTGYLTTEDACDRLGRCPCGYSGRTKRLDYEALRGQRAQAVTRAALLDRKNDGEAVELRNPWTSVHVLVDTLFAQA